MKDRNVIGWTALLCAAGFNPNPMVVSVLIKAGLPVVDRDEQGRTPLMLAVEKNPNPEMITVLAHLYYLNGSLYSFFWIIPVDALGLGLMVMKTKTISTSIIAHGTVNGFGYLLRQIASVE